MSTLHAGPERDPLPPRFEHQPERRPSPSSALADLEGLNQDMDRQIAWVQRDIERLTGALA
ncbi:MAG: hypothetical protein AAF468_06360 [Pseudomonadota bacterium]